MDCLATDGKPFICPKCGKEGRRHSKSICQDCYWQAHVVKKMKDAVFLLNSNWTGKLYHDFMVELAERIGAKPAALRAEQYFIFFARLDTLFEAPEEITEVRMITIFGKEGLRRHAVPYGYLKRVGIIPDADSYAAREAAERRKQQSYLKKAENKWHEPLIKEFIANQWAISYRYRDRGWTGNLERFVPKTITENLKAAVKFLGAVEETIIAVQQIDQVCLDGFIAANPGSRNGIRSFVRFLNLNKKLFKKIKIQNVPTQPPVNAILNYQKYSSLLEAWLDPPENEIKESLICLLMMLYAQPANKLVKMRLSDFSKGNDGIFRVVFGSSEISLDERVGKLLRSYLDSRIALATMEDDWHNEYLFTGRSYGFHLTEAAVTYQLKKYNVTAEQLFSSALFYAYQSGLQHPKVLVKAFGITDQTAIKYINLLNPKMMNAANRVANG
ncbi:hypothetical protein [Geobacter sp. OR-1]|uniref:hypothetical protein n=1 Tax=Geobacter sp. OR-1 TaxID=1266765 RepID=UPI0005A87752|nr:hypothetical protein [Geobacter sp. OR-1]